MSEYQQMLDDYHIAKNLDLYSIAICPICRTQFIKERVDQAFDSKECQKAFWNTNKSQKHNMDKVLKIRRKVTSSIDDVSVYKDF